MVTSIVLERTLSAIHQSQHPLFVVVEEEEGNKEFGVMPQYIPVLDYMK